MKNRSILALAFSVAMSVAVSPALSQQAPAAAAPAVIKPNPAASAAANAPAAAEQKSVTAAPAMSATIASTPPAMPAAKAPEAAPAAAPAATADIRLPAPKLTLPATPPAVANAAPVEKPAANTASAAAPAQPAGTAVVLKNPVGAGQAAVAAGEKPAGDAAKKPVKKLAGKKQADESKKIAANEKAKEPAKKFGLFRKKEEPVEVSAKVAPGEVVARTRPKFFFGLFDAPKPEEVVLSPEQVAYDQKLAAVPEKKKFKVKEEFIPVTVPFKGYKPGSIVIDTKSKYLYFVESPATALRYAVAVGKEGLLFTGKATVGAKQPWPRWIPTKEMIERDPKKYGRYADGMDGGPDNPLGARAIYLYQGKQDTYLRIHGTNQPQSIGTASSNGCFRMINEHVIDLYKRVGVGAEVVVL
jgi:lipoprotein-anchoring transpeptidase ErfK/SrfK